MIGLLFAVALAAQDAPPLITVRPVAPEERINPPAQGDWRTIWDAEDSTAGIDVASVTREGPVRKVWVARISEPLPDMPGSYSLVRMELDCDKALARPLWFAMHAASGAGIAGFVPAEAPAPYGPGSGGAAIAAMVCTDRPFVGPGFPTHQAFAASVTETR
ncbi:surface-adhesin E family protein [Brevundimonas lenta]|uniref:Surface-adhesin protein E-like domain-containing protein n=1 Tax=Brevundimonas lenta TaxID=424796 RepID=A0A7W6NR00_9CAUL|nr:surface-adhesin E family protein [Brevundimonas lenta]MBB4083717.1 hypothetical protein [Brevundimonas lenta]